MIINSKYDIDEEVVLLYPDVTDLPIRVKIVSIRYSKSGFFYQVVACDPNEDYFCFDYDEGGFPEKCIRSSRTRRIRELFDELN